MRKKVTGKVVELSMQGWIKVRPDGGKAVKFICPHGSPPYKAALDAHMAWEDFTFEGMTY